MSQGTLLRVIASNPGIEQSKISGGTAKQLRQLLKRKEIRRIPVSGKHGTTFRLYPAEG